MRGALEPASHLVDTIVLWKDEGSRDLDGACQVGSCRENVVEGFVGGVPEADERQAASLEAANGRELARRTRAKDDRGEQRSSEERKDRRDDESED